MYSTSVTQATGRYSNTLEYVNRLVQSLTHRIWSRSVYYLDDKRL